MSDPFWKIKSLAQMSAAEWESVCDGCAKCCLQQLEDEQTGQLVFTDVACDLLDDGNCRCSDYTHRSIRVASCMTLTTENVEQCAEFAPPSCAYRLLIEGQDLPAWHHLVSGSRETIHLTGNSVQGRVRFQRDTDPQKLEDYVVEWP